MKETFNGGSNLSVLHGWWTESCLVGIAGGLSVRAMPAVMMLVRCITNRKEKYCLFFTRTTKADQGDKSKYWVKCFIF